MIGFTGTQRGMTGNQLASVTSLLRMAADLYPRYPHPADGRRLEFHHGLCVGSDEQAHGVATDLGMWTVGHPASDVQDGQRSPVVCCEVALPIPAMKRNDIIASFPILIATPAEEHSAVLRSGTWATVRRGWKSPQTLVYIVRPSGRVGVTEGT